VIATPMTESLDTPQKHIALRRIGRPIELSNLIVYLASQESSFSTNAEFIARDRWPGAIT
jgi:3alpha(or 20beta)-hydroxysteroid dehydrogenase